MRQLNGTTSQLSMDTIVDRTQSPEKKERVIKRKPGRPSVDLEINIEHLCEVAVNVFAEKGYSGTTTTEITKKAGVARSLIHYYFGNKEELWKASIKRLAQEFIREFESSRKIHKDLTGTQMIKVVIRQLVYFFAKYPAFPRIIAQEMTEKDERTDWIIQVLIYPLYNLTGELFKTQRKLGTIKKIDKEHQSAILIGMAYSFFSNPYLVKALYNIETFDDETIERYADSVVEIFCYGIVNNSN